MQIKNIKISNILNYGYVDNLNKVKGISFTTKEKGVTNIIIGPNSSGKSNLLEIINQTLKVGLQKDFVYDKELCKSIYAQMEKEKNENNDDHKKDFKKVITEYPAKTNNLAKHKDFESQKSKIYIQLLLHKGDFDNMRFLLKYREKINAIIEKYSNCGVEFGMIDKNILSLENQLTLYFNFDAQNHTITLKKRNLNPIQEFILQYIQHKELIQICMHLYNKFEKKEDELGWYSLKNTFAILGSHRTFGLIKNKTYLPNLSSYDLNKIIFEQGTKNRSEWPLGYYLCKRKIKELTHYKLDYQKEFVDDINSILQKYFGLQLIANTNLQDNNVHFRFLTDDGHIFHVDELSSGLQSIIFIVLTLFGHDLYHGLCMIDEPELHLHPQLQKKLIEALYEIQNKLSIQIVVATHSPLFIDEKNIYNVIRLAVDKAGISIKSPSSNISRNEANLIHMLKYEHMTKMFFVPKIIMVEGETDSYFLDFYINHLQKNGILPATEYELLPIGGKGSFKNRKTFLTKFGIESYYIGDWDNVLETIPVPAINQYKRMMYGNRPENKEYHINYKTEFYKKVIQILKEKDIGTYNRINKLIEKYYNDDIFLFKEGDLETYLGMTRKGLEETIEFCYKSFETWLTSINHESQRKEMENILHKIFGSARD